MDILDFLPRDKFICIKITAEEYQRIKPHIRDGYVLPMHVIPTGMIIPIPGALELPIDLLSLSNVLRAGPITIQPLADTSTRNNPRRRIKKPASAPNSSLQPSSIHQPQQKDTIRELLVTPMPSTDTSNAILNPVDDIPTAMKRYLEDEQDCIRYGYANPQLTCNNNLPPPCTYISQRPWEQLHNNKPY